eukprot:scaffold7101_cov153-Amphora_coffeaeformis.AAC.13
MASSSSPSTSLSAVAGLWKRLTEEDPVGDTVNADRDTMVLWTQSKESGIYVDIRLPKDSPGLSLEAAKEIQKRPSALDGTMSHSLVSQLDVLMRHKSFAGVLDIRAGDTTGGKAAANDPTLQKLIDDPQAILPLCTCFWRRDIDYQPPTGDLDIGVCASAATVVDGHLWLRETGADASYAEDWSRPVTTSEGPFMALQLLDDHRVGYWVRAGDCFAYAVGRPTNPEAGPSARVHTSLGKSLADAVQELTSTNEERLDVLGSYVGVAGRINDQNEWVIHHSINPELVGCLLAGSKPGVSCSQLEQQEDDQVVQIIASSSGDQVRRTWKVIELTSGCKLPL